MEHITYQTNEQLWRIESTAASAGYEKTSDCYWAQIFRNHETGHEFCTSREENSTNDPAADRPEYACLWQRLKQLKKTDIDWGSIS